MKGKGKPMATSKKPKASAIVPKKGKQKLQPQQLLQVAMGKMANQSQKTRE